MNTEEIYLETMMGEEPRRYINSLKRWATTPPKRRLQDRCVERITLMWVAQKKYEMMRSQKTDTSLPTVGLTD